MVPARTVVPPPPLLRLLTDPLCNVLIGLPIVIFGSGTTTLLLPNFFSLVISVAVL